MTSKIISGVLILITVYLNVKHGWSGVMNKMNPEETKMLADLGIDSTMTKIIGILSLVVAIMTLIPQTFFAGASPQCRVDTLHYGACLEN
jgi:hypothetical protein